MNREALNFQSPDEFCLGCFAEAIGNAICESCGFDRATAGAYAQALPPGTILREQYLIGRVLGAGGFGITYLAWDKNLSLRIAIKEYFPAQWAMRDPDTSAVSVHSDEAGESFRTGLDRFLEEGRTLARFHQVPGIVSVLNFFRENNTGYLVMSYVDGITLKQYLEDRGGRVPFEVAAKILMPVMDALAQVHEEDVLHRDISPDNIYITGSGQVKLLDFGAARIALAGQQQSMSVIYKPGFAPPEQYMSQGKQGRWTDVYALGATLYRAITGITPAQSVERFYRDELQWPSAMGIPIPPPMETALRLALAVDFTQRFQTMRDFQRAILHPELTMSIPGHEEGEDENLAEKLSRLDSGKKGAARVDEEDKEKSRAGERKKSGEFLGRYKAPLLGLSLLGLIGILLYAFRGSLFPPGKVDDLIVGRWEMPFALDGTPIGAHWQFTRNGKYTMDFTYKDSGELQVHNGSAWSLASKRNLPRGGALQFVDANTITLSGFPLTAQPKVTLKRRVPLAAGGKAAMSLIGIWETNFQDFGVDGKRVLTVHESGETELLIVGHGAGTLEARQGLWKLKSTGVPVEDYGTYMFLDPNIERPNRLQFLGHTFPLMMWERTLEEH